MSPDTIAHYLGIKIGDAYDPEKIRQNFHALWDVGLLENVHIEAEREAGGVTLLVTIEERPIIKDIEFTGNKKLSSSQIRDVLKEGKAEVKVGGTPLASGHRAGARGRSPRRTSRRASAAPRWTTGSRTSRRPRRRSSS